MNWFESRSLPVNDFIILAVISNPEVTYDDLEAIRASTENQYGCAYPLVRDIMDAESELVLQGYYASL